MGRNRWKKGPPRGRGKQGREVEEQGAGEDEQARGCGFQGPRGEEGKPQGGAGKEKGKPQPGPGKEKGAGGYVSFEAGRTAKTNIARKFRKKLQKTFADVPKFTLQVHEETKALKKEIQRSFQERDGRFRFMRSTLCQKVPVTPPHHSKKEDQSDEANIRDDEITYHILVFKSEKGILEVLIREYDGYVIAIRRQPTNGNKQDGWFVCSDVELPEHLFGGRNWKIPYNTGYKSQELVKMGKGFLQKLVEVLIDFDEANYKRKNNWREKMLETLKVFVGEVQRLPGLLRFCLINLDAELWVPVGDILAYWTNHWSKLGNAIMHLEIAFLLKNLEEKAAEREAKVEIDEAYSILKLFKEAHNIPLSQDDLVGSIPGFVGMRPYFKDLEIHMHRQFDKFVHGIAEDRDKLSLPLLITYVSLIKFDRKLVPELVHLSR